MEAAVEQVKHSHAGSRSGACTGSCNRWALAAVLLLAPLLGSCASGRWDRSRSQSQIREDRLAQLPPSGVGLDRCLEILGAPNYVWEHRVHGLICVWAWSDARGLSAKVSGTSQNWTRALSFSYTDARLEAEGLVLWFDDDWVLEGWRTGYLRDLTGEPPRPATVEEIEETAG